MEIKFDFISDLHIDFYIPMYTPEHKLKFHAENYIDMILPEHPQDILVVAGDLGHSNQQNALILQLLGEKYKRVFVTFGNHDLYLISKSQRDKYNWNSLNRTKEMISLIYDIDNVYYLDGDIYMYNDIKFSGTDMWYDGKLSNIKEDITRSEIHTIWEDYMNDGCYIYDMIKFDEFYETEVKKLNKNVHLADVYVSHVGPVLPPYIPLKYDNRNLRFFYFDGSEYLKAKAAPKVWVYGHVHGQYDFQYEKTNLVCNPLGYPSENILRTKKIRNYETYYWED